jgi:hypothetical protein
MFYYRGSRLFAVRSRWYKAHFQTQPGYGGRQPEKHDPPLLFHLGHDPGEQRNIAAQHPEVVATIRKLATRHQAEFKPPASQLEIPLRRKTRNKTNR